MTTGRSGSPSSRSSVSSVSGLNGPASRVSIEYGLSIRSATIWAVCSARSLGEVTMASGAKPEAARNRPSRSAWRSPFRDRGRTSSSPCQASGSPASACRMKVSSTISDERTPVSRVRLRIEVLDVAGHEVDDILGDVRGPVADPLEVMRRDDDPRAPLDVCRVGAHELADLVERSVVQAVDLVFLHGDVPGADRVRLYNRPQDAVD